MMEKVLTTIAPKKPQFGLRDLKEIWNYRELWYFFTWRDIKVRYKQTVIGIIWAILQPVSTMIVFSIFFGGFAKIPSENVPYPVFVYTGLLLWQLFSAILSDVSNSLINNQSILTKVYFPRLIIPLSIATTNLVDFGLSFVVLVLLMLFFNLIPTFLGVLIMPLLVVLTVFSALGLGLVLASINIKYRDVRYVLPFFIQLLLFVTPVIYPASLLKDYTWIIGINPMAGIISTARASMLNITSLSYLSIIISAVVSFGILIFGVYIFRKNEISYADFV